MAEKVRSRVTQTERDVESTTQTKDADHVHTAEEVWKPGYKERFPTIGVLCLVGVVLCAVAIVIVLCVSNHKSSAGWPTACAPNVVIGGVNSLANILLGTAVTEGVTIAWWRRAMSGATIQELHGAWRYSIGDGVVFLQQFQWNAIALAALAIKLSVADSVLLQLAAGTYTAPDRPRNITMLGVASAEFPTTGYVVSNTSFGAQTNCDCYMIGDTYTPVVTTWEDSNGFFPGYQTFFQTCDGVCYTHVKAVGFEIDCNKQKNHEDLAEAPLAAYKASNGSSADAAEWSDIAIFNSSFSMSYPDVTKNYSRINLNLAYFQSDNPYAPSSETCPGNATSIVCELRPAMINYPVKVMNYNTAHVVNGVSLDTFENALSTSEEEVFGAYDPTARMPYSYTDKQAEGFEVLEYLYPNESGDVDSRTALGGMANALSQYLASSAAITYTGGSSWSLAQTGTLSQQQMYGPPNMGSCDCSFRDASLDVLVAGINELAFLTATGLINQTSYPNTTSKKVKAGTHATVTGIDNSTTSATWTDLGTSTQIKDVVFYQTKFLYMGLGIGFMILCVALVLPTYWRYGELGRKMTLGPMEVAHAFGAPMLQRTDEGQVLQGHDMNDVIKVLGKRQVKYGFVDEDGGSEGHGGVGDSTPPPTQPAAEGEVREVSQTDVPTSPALDDQGNPILNRRRTVVLRIEQPTRVRSVAFSPGNSPSIGPTSPKPGAIRSPKRSSTLWS